MYAESVCDHASWIAQASGANIELLHVIGRRQAARQDVSGTIALGARTSMLEELTRVEGDMARIAQQHGRALLDGAAERIAAAGLARPETRLRIGDLIDETNEALTDASMLVIGKRGEAADFARMHLGSNLERMVRSSLNLFSWPHEPSSRSGVCSSPMMATHPRAKPWKPWAQILCSKEWRSSF